MVGHINSGDTAFILICAALVALMTPWSGLSSTARSVRRKNFLAIMMQSFISMGVVTTDSVFFGYSLAFSGDVGGIIGNFHWVVLNHVGQLPGSWAPTIPAQAHFVDQEMFAIITPALITGAFADRVKFKSLRPRAVEHHRLHPVRPLDLGRRLARPARRAWGRRRGFRLSAGMRPWRRCSSWASASSPPASAACLTTWPSSPSAPACCGSAGSASTAATETPPTASPPRPGSTPTSPGRSPCAPAAVSWWADGRPSLGGALTGAVAGLGHRHALRRLRAHLGGIRDRRVGRLLVPLRRRLRPQGPVGRRPRRVGSPRRRARWASSCSASWPPIRSTRAGGQGLITGHFYFFGWQVTTAVVVAAYAFVATYLILKLINLFDPIRVPDSVELKGLDDSRVRRGGLRPDLKAAPARAVWPCRPAAAMPAEQTYAPCERAAPGGGAKACKAFAPPRGFAAKT